MGKVPWEELQQHRSSELPLFLSLKGKNVLFLERLAGILKLNNLEEPNSWPDFKAAFDEKTVREIYELIPQIWPTQNDLIRLLDQERKSTSGLYVGNYEPELLFRGITRHSLYADSILLIDPFKDPRNFRPEFNPVENPDQHRTNAIRAASLWLVLAPWIEAGIVKIIRSPGDFDLTLERECWTIEKKKFADNPDLKAALEKTTDRHMELATQFREYMLLSHPDEEVVAWYHADHPNATPSDIDSLVKILRSKRREHPYYSEWHNMGSQLHIFSSGTNYEMAKITASLTGSCLITDLDSRWKELEWDRGHFGVEANPWVPFAKAFHQLQFKFLNDVPLTSALKLRKEQRLESMRRFLHKTWKASTSDDPLSEANIYNLTAELEHELQEAESEWKSIDRELAKWFGVEVATSLLALPQAIATGTAHWVGAAVVTAGITNLISTWHRRSSFIKRYPAGFFLGLPERE